ncbi:MAG: phosphoglycerate kinase [Candidatus Kerfeldbacteria bacterium]|nr:phosphoglycerate kinase [Candidatus Kerfeldbacteria bacterium]
MRLRDLRTAAVKNQRVLVRVDYNIAADGRGRLRDDTRLAASRPTIDWLRRHQASVILLSHRGRPKSWHREYSLRMVARPLARLLRQPVEFLDDRVGSSALRLAIERLRPGSVTLLENLRFYSGEADNNPAFARRLAALGDLFVNEAFAVSHRASASLVRLPLLRPAYAGLHLMEEVDQLQKVMRRPRRPYVAILGGAKISTKLGLVKRLIQQADHVLLGGALANTILRAEGLAIGASLSEPAMLAKARGLSVKNKHLHIPIDVVVVRGQPRPRARSWVRPVGKIAPDEVIADIGPDSVSLFSRIIAKASTLVWNGPMGVYENPPFDTGTRSIARAIARAGCRSVAGGGETVDAIRDQGLARHFTFVSTGGGAMVEFLEGKMLAGLRALVR